MWSVYVLKHSTTNDTYIGLTNDLDRRLKEHNSGGQTSTHRVQGQWDIVYVEQYRDKRDAVQRELRFKQHGRAKQELLKRIQLSLGD